ncbi:MAG: hypothetical protein PVS2B1_22870 [Candidatus Dormibacteraceae bacterium]
MDLMKTLNRVLGGTRVTAGQRVRAVWAGATLAESDDTELVEGNHYFPAGSIDRRHFRESSDHTVCPWKGTASYLDVVVGEQVNRGAAWYYPDPKPAASGIKGRIAFWHGVKIVSVPIEEASSCLTSASTVFVDVDPD